jgi:LysM repeat protein
MTIDAINTASIWAAATQTGASGQSSQGPPEPPAMTETASLLGISTSELSSDMQSGTTLASLASEKGISSSDLLSAVEQDMQTNAPSGAPSLSSSQLNQIATNLINGTQPTPLSGGSDSSQGSNPSGPSLTNTAQLLGVSQSQLSSDLQSGTTLSELAEENGVTSSDLLSSVESDLSTGAPQGAPSLSSGQLAQLATNIINGTGPSSSSSTAGSNLDALSDATGVNSSVLLTQLSSGMDMSSLLEAPGQTGYGSSVADTIDGGVAVDEYA